MCNASWAVSVWTSAVIMLKALQLVFRETFLEEQFTGVTTGGREGWVAVFIFRISLWITLSCSFLWRYQRQLWKCSFCSFPGSHGCHLFSTEPEDKSACVGACGSIQSSSETQHEETHLNRHVGTRRSGFGLDLTLSQTLIRKRCAHAHRPKSWPVPPPVSPFNLFIWCTRHIHARSPWTRLHCRRSELKRKGENHTSVTARGTDLYLFLQLSYALALVAFHSFFLAWGRNAPADVLLHCDWLIQSCLVKLCPPTPTALYLHSAILFLLPQFIFIPLSLFAFALLTFSSKWSNGLCVRVLAGWYWVRDAVRLFPLLKLKRYDSAWGGLKSPSGSKSSASTFENIKACVHRT